MGLNRDLPQVSDDKLALMLGQRVGQLLVMVGDPTYPRAVIVPWAEELAVLVAEAVHRLSGAAGGSGEGRSSPDVTQTSG